jgi:integrase
MSANQNKKNDSEPIGDRVSMHRRGDTWYANFQFEGRQRRISLKTSSKKQARTLAIRLDADLTSGQYTEQARAPLVKAVVDAYLAALRGEGRARKTMQKMVAVTSRLIEMAERRKAKSILDIDLRFMDAYRAERRANVGDKTIYTESVIVRQVVNFALRRRMIAQDPLRGLRLRKVKSRPQPFWEHHQVEQILGDADGGYKTILQVLAYTGMRVGEAMWLTWDDVDPDCRVIQIRGKDDWKPKTGDQRVIPIPDVLRQVLLAMPRSGRWVLTAPSTKSRSTGDRQFSDRRLLVYLKKLLKARGLPGHVHTFRHSFISHAIINRTPEAIVRQWVGHVDPEILKHYTHIADRTSAQAMSVLFDRVDTTHDADGKEVLPK